MPQTGPDQKLRILAVVAHPHDITHMCGTLAHHIQRGDSVSAVSVTGGEHMHHEKLADELRKPPADRDPEVMKQIGQAQLQKKAHEMEQVCAIFGIADVRILPFPDTWFEPTRDVIETLIEVILDVRPHVVLTHAPYKTLTHGHALVRTDDHVDVGIAVATAVSNASMPDAASGRVAHRVAAVYYSFPDKNEDADFFIDITDQAENRLNAEMLFTSQAHTEDFVRKRVEIGAGLSGWWNGTGYAEAWACARQDLLHYLPVADETVEAAERSSMEKLKRMGARVSKGK